MVDDQTLSELVGLIVKHQKVKGCALVMAQTYPIAVQGKSRVLHSDPQAVLKRISLKKEALSHDLSGLVDALFLANKQPIAIAGEATCAGNGYVMSGHPRYASYFKDSWGGELLLKENSEIKEIITISVPVYDKETGGVLVYIQSYCGALCARGGVYLFEKKDGELIYVSGGDNWRS